MDAGNFSFTGDPKIFRPVLNDLRFRWNVMSDAAVIKKALLDCHKKEFGGNQTLDTPSKEAK